MSRKFYIGLFIVALAAVIVYGIDRDLKQCDEVVFIEGELGQDAQHVSSFRNGMSVIYFCDGTSITIPTHRIIKIVDKE
jgi:uncharacterized protein (UPF0248 family)